MIQDAPAVLVTGGLGYIGSHAVVALAEAGFESVIVDNCSNSSTAVLQQLELLCTTRVHFYLGDVRDRTFLESVVRRHPQIVCCLHFAGLKAVGDSMHDPLSYHDNNVAGSIALLQVLESAGCRRLVFSSSATVYGDPVQVPIDEQHRLEPVSPYGQSKLAVERILADVHAARLGWSIVVLRYFNPGGAHPSGLIGERPSGRPNNLMPYVSQVANSERKHLEVYGDDYPTRDGTGERDYLHVVDLADAHVRAIDLTVKCTGLETINLGTGRGHTVLEVIEAYAAATGLRVPYVVVPRRIGDVASCFADASRAGERLQWTAMRSLTDICRDAARFEANHGTAAAEVHPQII